MPLVGAVGKENFRPADVVLPQDLRKYLSNGYGEGVETTFIMDINSPRVSRIHERKKAD